MAWTKATSKTLDATNNDITTDTFTASKTLQFIDHTIVGSGNVVQAIRVGNGTIDSSGTDAVSGNYALRRGYNGANEVTRTYRTHIHTQEANYGNSFGVVYVLNIAGKEKLFISHNVDSGSSTIVGRTEVAGKWANTTDQINVAGLTEWDSGSFGSGTNLTVIGSDGTAQSISPETNSIFVESDSARRYWFDGNNWQGNSVTYDNQAIIQNGSVGTSAPTTFSNFTVGNNPNRILVVACGSYNSSPDITGITWNGSENFTHIVRHTHATSYKVELWYLVNPTPTTANVVISSSGMGQMGAIVYSFYNVDQSAPIGAVTKYTTISGTTTPSLDITPTNTGSMIVDCWYNGANSVTPNNDLTDGVNIICGGVDRSMASQYSLTPTIGSVNSMSRTSGAGNGYVQIACEIKNG